MTNVLSYKCDSVWHKLHSDGSANKLSFSNLFIFELIEMMFRMVAFDNGIDFIQLGYDDSSIWIEYPATGETGIEREANKNSANVSQAMKRVAIGLEPYHASMVWEVMGVVLLDLHSQRPPGFLCQWHGIVKHSANQLR